MQAKVQRDPVSVKRKATPDKGDGGVGVSARHPFSIASLIGGDGADFGNGASGVTGGLAEAGIQAKMVVHPADDKYEREADSVADRVVQQSGKESAPVGAGMISRLASGFSGGVGSGLGGNGGGAGLRGASGGSAVGADAVVEQKAEEEPVAEVQQADERVQAQGDGDCGCGGDAGGGDAEQPVQGKGVFQGLIQRMADGGTLEEGTEQQIQSRKGGGSALPDDMRSEMESGIGADFSGVKVHTDSQAADLNRSMGARAFTQGNDIFFGQGQYDPGTQGGKHLLAHELTHTVQQGAAEELPQTENSLSQADKPESTELADAREPLINETIKATDSSDQSKKERSGDAPNNEIKNQEGEQVDSPNTQTGSGTDAEVDIDGKKAGGKKALNPVEGEMVAGTDEESVSGPEEKIESIAVPLSGELQLPRAERGTVVSSAKQKIEAYNTGTKGEAFSELEEKAADVCSIGEMKTGVLAKNETTHDTADQKAEAARDASVQPESLSQGKANEAHTAAMERMDPEEMNKEKVEKEFKRDFEDNAPQDLSELNLFGKKAKSISRKVLDAVGHEVNNTQQELGQMGKTPKPLDLGTPTPLPAPEVAPPTQRLQLGKNAVPDISDEKVDMTKFTDDIGGAQAEEGISDEQLSMVDSGPLLRAQESKDEAGEKAGAAPNALKAYAAERKRRVEADMDLEENVARKDMRSKRDQEMDGAQKDQKKAKTKIEKERARVGKKINEIYGQIQEKVNQKLTDLERYNEETFNSKQDQYTKEFKRQVESDLDDWKDERYSGLSGKWTWVKDRFRNLDNFYEVKAFFNRARSKYIDKVNQLVADIHKYNNTIIEECKQIIADGKKEISEYVANLEPDLQKTGQEAAADIEQKFASLDRLVEKKREDLSDKLCQMKDTAIEEIDEKIEEMKAELASIFEKFLRFIMDALLKFFTWALKAAGLNSAGLIKHLKKAADGFTWIITHPIQFLGRLISAVGDGFKSFGNNIREHLTNGLVDWLTGAMGEAAVQVPAKWDAQGALQFVLSVAGLTWGSIRKRLVKHIPEKVIAYGEQSVALVQKVINEGPIAMWEYIKAEAAELKTKVFDSIKGMLAVELVKKGVLTLTSFLIPGAGWVRAILAIYDTVMFFLENIRRIFQLVMEVIGTFATIASNNLSGASQAIERSMAMTLPIIFSFMARLLRLGSLSRKVLDVIKKLRKPIDKLLDRIVKFFVKLLSRKKKKKGDPKKNKEEAKHKQYANEMKQAMEKPSKESKGPKIYEDKKDQAKKLEKKYNAKLVGKIKASIQLEPFSGGKKDGDFDFKIRIAPNDAVAEGSTPAESFIEEIKEYASSGTYTYAEVYAAFQEWNDLYKSNLDVTFKITKPNKNAYFEFNITAKDTGETKASGKDARIRLEGEIPEIEGSTERKEGQFEAYINALKAANPDSEGAIDTLGKEFKTEVNKGGKTVDIEEMEEIIKQIYVIYGKLFDYDIKGSSDLPKPVKPNISSGQLGLGVQSIEANYLSIKSPAGTEPLAKNILGWKFITGDVANEIDDPNVNVADVSLNRKKTESGEYKISQKWVRMHMVNERFSGIGLFPNLVPGTKANNVLHRDHFEKQLKDYLMNKDSKGNYRVAGMRATVEYHSDTEYSEANADKPPYNVPKEYFSSSIGGGSIKSSMFAKKMIFESCAIKKNKDGEWDKNKTAHESPLVDRLTLENDLPNWQTRDVASTATVTNSEFDKMIEATKLKGKANKLLKSGPNASKERHRRNLRKILNGFSFSSEEDVVNRLPPEPEDGVQEQLNAMGIPKYTDIQWESLSDAIGLLINNQQIMLLY